MASKNTSPLLACDWKKKAGGQIVQIYNINTDGIAIKIKAAYTVNQQSPANLVHWAGIG